MTLRCPPGCTTARQIARERILRACELLSPTEALGLLDEVRRLLVPAGWAALQREADEELAGLRAAALEQQGER